MKKNRFFKNIMIIIMIAYVSCIFINQQKTLNAYQNGKEYNEKRLQEEKEYKQSLINIQNNIDSSEYIEQIAREKLYMYLPNEKVYVDRSKQ